MVRILTFLLFYVLPTPIFSHIGLYATILAQNNTVEVSAMAHPSLLTIPADQNTLKAQSKVPVQIHNGELDTILTPALALQVDGVLGNGQYTPGYSRSQWPGVGHGFAVCYPC